MLIMPRRRLSNNSSTLHNAYHLHTAISNESPAAAPFDEQALALNDAEPKSIRK